MKNAPYIIIIIVIIIPSSVENHRPAADQWNGISIIDENRKTFTRTQQHCNQNSVHTSNIIIYTHLTVRRH